MFCARHGSVQPRVPADPHPLQREIQEAWARKVEEERKRKEAERAAAQRRVAAWATAQRREEERAAAQRREAERAAALKREEEARAAQCRATTKAGARCQNRAPQGANFCTRHARLDPPPPEYTPIYCAGTTTAGNQCRRWPSKGSSYCETHTGAVSDTECPERAREKQRAEEPKREDAEAREPRKKKKKKKKQERKPERVAQPSVKAYVPADTGNSPAKAVLAVLIGVAVLVGNLALLWLILQVAGAVGFPFFYWGWPF